MYGPYEKYRNTALYLAIEGAIADLELNNDITLTTTKHNVVGYLTKQLIELRNQDDDCPQEKCFRIYIDEKHYYFSTFEEAKLEAERHMKEKPELRIEILVDAGGADFWAFEYHNKQWVPS